jgi:hypothetical protein
MVAVDQMYVRCVRQLGITDIRCRERGVLKVPELLPKDYTGSDQYEGSIGI